MASVLEKLKALDEQRALLLEGAKKEALEKAEKAVTELIEQGTQAGLLPGPPTVEFLSENQSSIST